MGPSQWTICFWLNLGQYTAASNGQIGGTSSNKSAPAILSKKPRSLNWVITASFGQLFQPNHLVKSIRRGELD